MSSSGASMLRSCLCWSYVTARLNSTCPRSGVPGSSVIIGGPASAWANRADTIAASRAAVAKTRMATAFILLRPKAENRRRLAFVRRGNEEGVDLRNEQTRARARPRGNFLFEFVVVGVGLGENVDLPFAADYE